MSNAILRDKNFAVSEMALLVLSATWKKKFFFFLLVYWQFCSVVLKAFSCGRKKKKKSFFNLFGSLIRTNTNTILVQLSFLVFQ